MTSKKKCEKLKREIKILLSNPHKIYGSPGVIISKEEMAIFRINYLWQQAWDRMKKEQREALREAKITKAKARRRLGLTTAELIDKLKTLLTSEEKAEIFEKQKVAPAIVFTKEKVKQQAEDGRTVTVTEKRVQEVPEYLFLDEEEITYQRPSECDFLNELLTKSGTEFFEEFGQTLEVRPKRTRKPSARNLFIGDMMRGGQMTMKEASDAWKELSEDEKKAWEP